jgi:hypothetical protein
MDAWSSLESTLGMVLSELIPIDLGDAILILPKLGMKNTLDLFEGLALRKLDPSSASAMVALLERTGRLNTKRNILVHGAWVVEANVIPRQGQAHLITQFLREIVPTDPEDAKLMANPRNQKERVRYTFTLKRIGAATRDTDAVNRDICGFLQVMKRRVLLDSEIGLELIRRAPYRVKYSSP